MSFGEELAKVDSERLKQLFDEIISPGGNGVDGVEFWLAQYTVAQNRFPALLALREHISDVRPSIEDIASVETSFFFAYTLGVTTVLADLGAYADLDDFELPDGPQQ